MTHRIEVRILASNEAGVLDRVADDVFDGPVDPALAAEVVADPRHHLAVALEPAGVVVGMASAIHHVHPDKRPQLFVNEVGVAPTYRGQGIGSRLVEALLERARAIGCTEAWVLTEADNEAAQALYRSTGGIVEAEPPVLFTFPLESRDPTAG